MRVVKRVLCSRSKLELVVAKHEQTSVATDANDVVTDVAGP